MRLSLRTCAIALALSLIGVGSAAAQGSPGSAAQSKPPLNLNQSQEQAVTQGLKSEAPQAQSPAAQTPQGSKLPDSVQAKPLPNNVTQAVPETKSYLFVKFPDRVLIIDPDTKIVAEIVLDPGATTGSGQGGAGAPPR
jgi:hypothetical protein